MNCHLRRVLTSLATLLIAAHAHAYEAGWMQIQTAGATPDGRLSDKPFCVAEYDFRLVKL